MIIGRDGIYSKTPDEVKALEAAVKVHDEVLALAMALTSDLLAKQMGSKAPHALLSWTDGKPKLQYPAVQPHPPGFVNYFEFDRHQNLAVIRRFVSSVSTNIHSGKMIPSPTTKALLNETISELNSAQLKALEWHYAAVEAQSLGALLPDSNAFEYAFLQVKASLLIYLAYVMKELVVEVERSVPQKSEGQQ